MLAFAGSTALIAGLAWLGGRLAWVQANLQIFVAALFLYLPALLLHRSGEEVEDYGLTSRPRRRNLLLFLAMSALVFPPYGLLFHGWTTGSLARTFEAVGPLASLVSGPERRLQPSLDAYYRLDLVLDGRPRTAIASGDARLFLDHDRAVIQWSGPGPAERPSELFSAHIETDGWLEIVAGHRHLAGAPKGGRLELSPRQRSGEVAFRVRGGEWLSVHPRRGGRSLDPQRLKLGPLEESAGKIPHRSDRSIAWLLWLLLTQLFLVALPEEFFYRGYIQGRLDGLWRGRVRVLGVEVGWSVVATSVLFALGHYLVDFSPQRLAVFFPSLLFGWLRCASGSIAAATGFHALCNIVVDLLGKLYVTP